MTPRSFYLTFTDAETNEQVEWADLMATTQWYSFDAVMDDLKLFQHMLKVSAGFTEAEVANGVYMVEQVFRYADGSTYCDFTEVA